jgi:Natural resistance-associated macrophage protein.
MVFLMGVSFTITAITLGSDFINILKASLLPSLTTENTFIVIALVGTTVVPYNLFCTPR